MLKATSIYTAKYIWGTESEFIYFRYSMVCGQLLSLMLCNTIQMCLNLVLIYCYEFALSKYAVNCTFPIKFLWNLNKWGRHLLDTLTSTPFSAYKLKLASQCNGFRDAMLCMCMTSWRLTLSAKYLLCQAMIQWILKFDIIKK